MDEVIFLQHPSHHSVSLVSIYSQGLFPERMCNICGKIDYFARNSAPSARDRDRNAVDRYILPLFVTREPISVENLVVGRLAVQNQGKGGYDLAVGQDAMGLLPFYVLLDNRP